MSSTVQLGPTLTSIWVNCTITTPLEWTQMATGHLIRSHYHRTMEPLEGTAALVAMATLVALAKPAALVALVELAPELGTPVAQTTRVETPMVQPLTSARMEAHLHASQIQIREAVTEAATQTRRAVTRSSRMRSSSLSASSASWALAST